MSDDTQTVKEVVGLFDDLDQMQKGIKKLEISGFSRRGISVLGSEKAVEEQFGKAQLPSKFLEDHPDAPRAPNVSKEEVGLGQGAIISTGMLTGAIAAVIASGGLIVPGAAITTVALGGAGGTAAGAVLAKLLGDKYTEFFQKQIDEGGLLLWITAPDAEKEAKAKSILKEYQAKDVHVHQLAQEDSQTSDALEPHIFADAFLRLDQMADEHKDIMKDDQMLQSKIDDLLETLKQTAANEDSVPEKKADTIVKDIEEVARYAKDMAREEQRVMAESPAEGAGKEEQEVMDYFDLANDLSDFARDCHNKTLHVIAA